MPARRPSCKPAPAHPRVSHNDWDNSLDDNNDSGMEMSGGGSGGGSEIGEIEESLKRTMAVDTGLRKEQKQQRLEKEFESQVRQLEGQIDERVAEGKEDVVRIQDAHLSRLLALSRRKAEVEAQIIEHTRELADAFLAVKEEFEAVLRGRSEDVSEAIESLNKLEEAASPKRSQ
ncbi:hypothetical protein PV05_09941 [Exophiala xenobiotica]|uniref:Uncharacterized protein n=1 Tax=Exophiala xenobiotica TaxID=348802 RepID=A0A0D2E6U2_9EURO|nr:uncharacterized protein PV05_09941 [Exophiala xenobiotica]KIW51198.1 hypothetical protein PV05_09941 [Exophiala xenobiotica]